MSKLVLSIATIFLVSSSAGAHPGHGEPGQGLSLVHHLTEPVHVLAALVSVLFVLAAVRAVRKRRVAVRRPTG